MEKTGWKTMAIIELVVILLFLVFMIWAVQSTYAEEARMDECYYDICGDYPEAWIDGNVCFCYEYDMLGNLIEVDREIIK